MPSQGGMLGGGGAAALLLPGCVLLDVFGGSAAFPHGGAGVQHHSESRLPDGCRLRSPCPHCHHISQRQLQRIRHVSLVSTVQGLLLNISVYIIRSLLRTSHR